MTVEQTMIPLPAIGYFAKRYGSNEKSNENRIDKPTTGSHTDKPHSGKIKTGIKFKH
jgi:hypothetical protein